MSNACLAHILAAIDAANSADPKSEDGAPAARVYGERMSAMLALFRPDASDLVKIAARGQHIERWSLPRDAYPAGKAGYYAWRNAAKKMHAERVGALMEKAGYSADEIAATQAMVRKDDLRANADAQTVEDVASLVFLKHYGVDFASGRTPEQLIDILVKTMRKMSPQAIAFAGKIGMPDAVAALAGEAAKKLGA